MNNTLKILNFFYIIIPFYIYTQFSPPVYNFMQERTLSRIHCVAFAIL